MKCPHHPNHEMSLLFTSSYCTLCEKTDDTTEKLYWWDLPYHVGMKVTNEMMVAFLKATFPGASSHSYAEDTGVLGSDEWVMTASIILDGSEYTCVEVISFSRVIADDAYLNRERYEFVTKLNREPKPT